MNDILSEMHAINDMDAILRCRIIANYLHTYGNFCCSIKDFVTATNFYKQAICLLKSAYSTTASNYAILAWSTQDLVVAYELSGELDEARSHYDMADNISNKVEDWSDEEKKKFVVQNTRNKQDVANKIKDNAAKDKSAKAN